MYPKHQHQPQYQHIFHNMTIKHSYIFLTIVLLMDFTCVGSSPGLENNATTLDDDTLEEACSSHFYADVDFVTVSFDSAGLNHDGKVFSKYLHSKHYLFSERNPLRSNNRMEDDAFSLERQEAKVRIYLEHTPTQIYLSDKRKDMNEEWIYEHSDREVFMCNSEFLKVKSLMHQNLELVICKTRQCVDHVKKYRELIWGNDSRYNDVVEHLNKKMFHILYTGFTTIVNEEKMKKTEVDYNKFLHVAGKSPYKGSVEVLQAWMQHLEWPTLKFQKYNNMKMDYVAPHFNYYKSMPQNIDKHDRKLPNDEFSSIIYSHGVHVCPSQVEGFGHSINEARAIGAVVITTDCPAMNEFFENDRQSGILIQPEEYVPLHDTGLMACPITPRGLEYAVQKVLKMSIEQRMLLGKRTKAMFEADQQRFQENMELLQCLYSYNDVNLDCRKPGTIEMCALSCGLTLE